LDQRKNHKPLIKPKKKKSHENLNVTKNSYKEILKHQQSITPPPSPRAFPSFIESDNYQKCFLFIDFESLKE